MKNLEKILEDLEVFMLTQSHSLSPDKNPTIQRFPSYSSQQKKHIIGQYSLFSRYIVRFLLEVLYKTSDSHMNAIANEMKMNISEELSINEEKKSPHYMLLCSGFKEAVGMNFLEIKPSNATLKFRDTIVDGIRNGNAAFASGVAYALESSAVPELILTRKLTIDFLNMTCEKIPKNILTFFDSHIDEIEIAHKGRLREVCLGSLTSSEIVADFQSGFHYLMNAMDSWWEQLDQENQQTFNNVKNLTKFISTTEQDEDFGTVAL